MTEETNQISSGANRWVVLAVAVLCYGLTVLIRYLWPAIASSAMFELDVGFGAFRYAWVPYSLACLLTLLPGGLLADRFGSRPVLVASLLIQGLSFMTMCLVKSLQGGLILMIISGLGGGLAYGACFKLLFAVFVPFKRQVFIYLLSEFAGLIATTLHILIMSTLHDPHSWRVTAQAVGPLVAGAFLLPWFCLTPKNQDLRIPPIGFQPHLSVITGRRIWLLVIAVVFLLGLANWGFHEMVVRHLSRGPECTRLDGNEIGLIRSFILLSAGLVAFLGLYLAYKKPEQKSNILLFSAIGLIFGLLLFSQSAGFRLAAVTGCLVGAFYGLAGASGLCLLIENMSPAWSGTGGGLYMLAVQGGSMLARPLIRNIPDSQSANMMIWGFLIILALGAAFCAQRMKKAVALKGEA